MFALYMYNCLHLYQQNEIIIMANIKTPNNKKKSGRPAGEPTTVISLRIPTELRERIKKKYGKNWMVLFKDFCRVYAIDLDEKVSNNS